MKPVKIYQGAIRTVCVAFASVFSNIKVRKYDENGDKNDEQLVEIAFSPKQAYALWVEQAMRLPNGRTEIGVRLPRLSFDMVGISIDTGAMTNPWETYGSPVTTTGEDGQQYVLSAGSPIPYTFNMQLSLWAKDMDTSIQVIEYIVPNFKPDLQVKVLEQRNIPVINDMRIHLDSISREDNYMEGFDSNRIISWNMDFSCHANIWQYNSAGDSGRLGEYPLVNEVIVDINDNSYGKFNI